MGIEARPTGSAGRSLAWTWPLSALLAACLVLALRHGSSGVVLDVDTLWRGALSIVGAGAPLDAGRQAVFDLRLFGALTAAGVGAALGVSGAYIQGVFRNGLASPGVLGISGGASLGAFAAVLVVGGYGPSLVVAAGAQRSALVLVPVVAFAGALGTALVVYRLAARGGRVSVPALLLVGIAVNTFVGGVQQLVQSLVLGDWDVSRSILLWTFGTLDDREGWHVAVVGAGLALALLAAPFSAYELDLLQAGPEDAAALGVDVERTKIIALGGASIAAGAAVAVAGQIAFVGLVVPHLVRLLFGRAHARLIPLSALVGALFLLGADVLQRLFFPALSIQPGVVMSLLGAPFFLWLLVRKRREVESW